MIRTIFWSYIALFIGLRIAIHFRTQHACGGTAQIETADGDANFLDQSDLYDQQCMALEGTVVESGNVFWDLFLIGTFSLDTEEGGIVRVFTNSAVPHIGAHLTVKGTFRQFFHGAYFDWVGLVESAHVYHNQETGNTIRQKKPESKQDEDADMNNVIDS